MKNELSFMLIDDDHVFNFIHRKQIEKFELSKSIKSFESPLRALHFLKNLSLENIPDIIFLDINMPELNGFAFLEKLKQERVELLNHLNVFVVTSSLNPEDYAASKSFECIKGYFNKPIDLEKIMMTVNWLLT